MHHKYPPIFWKLPSSMSKDSQSQDLKAGSHPYACAIPDKSFCCVPLLFTQNSFELKWVKNREVFVRVRGGMSSDIGTRSAVRKDGLRKKLWPQVVHYFSKAPEMKNSIPSMKRMAPPLAIFLSRGPSSANTDRNGPYQALFLKQIIPRQQQVAIQDSRPTHHNNSWSCNGDTLINV